LFDKYTAVVVRLLMTAQQVVVVVVIVFVAIVGVNKERKKLLTVCTWSIFQ
jgi:hypothetical protein